jgi:hypothetical protein
MTAELPLILDAERLTETEIEASEKDTPIAYTKTSVFSGELLILNDHDSNSVFKVDSEVEDIISDVAASKSSDEIEGNASVNRGTNTHNYLDGAYADEKEEDIVDRCSDLFTSSSTQNSMETNIDSNHCEVIDASISVTARKSEYLSSHATTQTTHVIDEAGIFNKTPNTTDSAIHQEKGRIIDETCSEPPSASYRLRTPSSDQTPSPPSTPKDLSVVKNPQWSTPPLTEDVQVNNTRQHTEDIDRKGVTKSDDLSNAYAPLSFSSLNVITQQVLHKIGETSLAQQQLQATANGSMHDAAAGTTASRRFIRLDLVEDEKVVEKPHKRQGSILSSFALRYRPRAGSLGSYADLQHERQTETHKEPPLKKEIVVASITVCWYVGTTTVELQEHVRKSIVRMLGKEVYNIRLLDYDPDDAEGFTEVVLSPHIPSGSKFIVKYTLAPPRKDTPVRTIYRYGETAPDSPSAALTPSPSISYNLSSYNGPTKYDGMIMPNVVKEESDALSPPPALPLTSLTESNGASIGMSPSVVDSPTAGISKEKVVVVQATQTQIKKHVIFTLANYFVLFLSIIAISAELHERAPKWMNDQLSQVQACAVDRDTLFECVSNGNISGLIASIALWLSKSKFTSRVFLFGFRTRNELWTVVYECFVTSFCWGFSYCFIRRGLNPDTRQNFISKYWKDTVYGSLAGFNAAFMKSVLKNLIPKEAVEEVFKETPQLSIVSMLGRLFGLPAK